MADLISTDSPLTPTQQRTLAAVLETLVPASEDGRLPSAAEVDFGGYLLTQAEDYLPGLAGTLDDLDEGFAGLSPDASSTPCRSG